MAEATDSPTAITVAIIGAVGVIGGSWIDTRRQARRLDDNAQLRFAEVHHRLDRVEGRIDQLYLLHGREVRPRGLEEVEAEAAP